MPTVDPPPDPKRFSPSVGRPWGLPDVAMLGVALAAWAWILAGLWNRPAEIAGLALAVPLLAGVGLGVDRLVGQAWGAAGVVAMAILGFAALAGLTGASPRTLAGFILGLVKPVGWTGDHLLLRVVPLMMAMAHPWRRSFPGAVVSALGVSAFLGIGLMILHAAG